MYPQVKDHNTFNVESFDSYVKRWPKSLNNIPKLVVKTWIYRHWSQFQLWIPLHPEKWNYELVSMPNEEVLKIDHINDWPKQFRSWGKDLIHGNHRKTTRLGRYMLEHGTTPEPIIIGKNFGGIQHPSEHKHMKEPLQLIEGHMRTSYLIGMIQAQHENLREHHDVWVATP